MNKFCYPAQYPGIGSNDKGYYIQISKRDCLLTNGKIGISNDDTSLYYYKTEEDAQKALDNYLSEQNKKFTKEELKTIFDSLKQINCNNFSLLYKVADLYMQCF